MPTVPHRVFICLVSALISRSIHVWVNRNCDLVALWQHLNVHVNRYVVISGTRSCHAFGQVGLFENSPPLRSIR